MHIPPYEFSKPCEPSRSPELASSEPVRGELACPELAEGVELVELVEGRRLVLLLNLYK
jgi:hypothetical protein